MFLINKFSRIGNTIYIDYNPEDPVEVTDQLEETLNWLYETGDLKHCGCNPLNPEEQYWELDSSSGGRTNERYH